MQNCAVGLPAAAARCHGPPSHRITTVSERNLCPTFYTAPGTPPDEVSVERARSPPRREWLQTTLSWSTVNKSVSRNPSDDRPDATTHPHDHGSPTCTSRRCRAPAGGSVSNPPGRFYQYSPAAVDMLTARQRARCGDHDGAIPQLRAAVDDQNSYNHVSTVWDCQGCENGVTH